MPLPKFNASGDLPDGVHRPTIEEVVARFGTGTQQRKSVTGRLCRIYSLSLATGKIDRLIVFGSYVSDIAEPNDVDVILVMENGFRPEECSPEARVLFDHSRADEELGASVFWIRPDMLLGEPLENFLEFWQTKRDGQKRGVVEIRHDSK